jgi:serine/threonine protein kinase
VSSISGIVLGMEYIHSKGFIHRDLKPENILLDDDLRVRIADFVSSRIHETDVTMARDCGSAPLYVAPEFVEGNYTNRHYSMKVDVYSFGLILYEIIVGDGLFSSPGDKMALFMKLNRGWRPEIPSGVLEISKSLIENCWKEDPNERPGFDDIWRIIKGCDFELIGGAKRAEVHSFLARIEEHGMSVDR